MASPNPVTSNPGTGCTLREYALHKCLPEQFLRDLGLGDISYEGKPAVRIPYYTSDGSVKAVQFRTAVRRGATGDPFRWRSGDKSDVYGLNRLPDAVKAGHVVIAEGPSDTQTLWYHGYPALGLPSARWSPAWDTYLDGIPEIYVVIEPGDGGEKVLKGLARSTLTDRLKIIDLGAYKDPSGLYVDDPAQFPTRWAAAVAAAIPWKDREQRTRKAAAAAAWAKCQSLAQQTDILHAFGQSARARGIVGEERTLKILYLALTSRVLARIVSVALKGPSSAGKSYLTEQTLGYFPAASYVLLTGMSEKALAYGDEPLSQRVLVVAEAAGAEASYSAYLLRTLLSEGYIAYQTVEKSAAGLHGRTIRREGPTGLLITTTAVTLHPENETRLLSLPVDDTPAQTRQVLIARAENQHVPPVPDEWIALQEWLSFRDDNEVEIPYAKRLAECIPPVATRLRRDYNAVLGLVSAHAVLHKATRGRTASGAIVATEADYIAVLELVADILAQGVGASVPARVRETVQAVQRLTVDQAGISVAAIAKELGLDPSTASRRVAQAEHLGYLRRTEDRRSKLLMPDMPLPGDVTILPDPADLFPARTAPCP